MDRAGWQYPPGEFRVSDADRDQALAELRVALQAGRVTADEFDERAGQVLEARTGNELTALLADLPVEHAPPPPPAIPEQADRMLATRVAIGASAIGAGLFGVVAVGAAVIQQASIQQQVIQARLAVQGLPGTVGAATRSSFDWASVAGPAVIALLLVLVAACLTLRVARADRDQA